MSWPWAADTVTRLRPVISIDTHGDEQPDWVSPDRLPCTDVMFAPAADGDGGTLYGRGDLDIAPGDHVEYAGRRFEVIGIPQRWAPGTVVVLEDVDIPGQ